MAKGIDIRATSSELVFRVAWNDGAATPAPLSSGSATLILAEVQDADATLKGYDFNSNTFKTTALTTRTASLTERTIDNSTYHTGIWTARLATLTGFTVGKIYVAIATHSTAGVQWTSFQFGGAEGDLAVVSSGGVDYLKSDVEMWNGTSVSTGVTLGALTITGGIDLSATGAANAILYIHDDGSGENTVPILLLKQTGVGGVLSINNAGSGQGVVVQTIDSSAIQITNGSGFAIAVGGLGGVNLGNVSMSRLQNTGPTTFSGNTTFGGTIGVAGTTTLGALNTGAVTHSTLQVSGTSSLAGLSMGALSMSSMLNSGTTTMAGNATLGGSLTVSGSTSLAAVNAGLLTISGFNNSGPSTYAGTITAPSTSNSWQGTLVNVSNVASTATIGGTGLAAIDTQLSGSHGAGAWGGGSGADAASLAAALASMGVIGISVYGPVAGQTIDLYRGDAYQNSEGSGRSIAIVKQPAETHWPDTLATVHFSCKPTAATLDDDANAESLSDIACTITQASGSDQAFRLELLDSQTGALTPGGYDFWFVANKDTAPATLRSGRLTIRRDPTS